MHYDPRGEAHGLPHDPITALVVPRPIGWITTVSATGVVNLAPYSFFNLIAGKPPFVMFSSEPAKDSQRNAEATGEFVFNLATYDLRNSMNTTASAFPPDVSEPGMAGLEMLPSIDVRPPRVALSPVALECRYRKTVALADLPTDTAVATMVIGEVVRVHIDDRAIREGRVDIALLRPIARLGYMEYCLVDHVFSMPKPA